MDKDSSPHLPLLNFFFSQCCREVLGPVARLVEKMLRRNQYTSRCSGLYCGTLWVENRARARMCLIFNA